MEILRRNLKPWLLGWVLGFIIGATFAAAIFQLFSADDIRFMLIIAILVLTTYVILALKLKWKPSLIATLLGIVINPLLWLGLFGLLMACGWGGFPWCSILSIIY